AVVLFLSAFLQAQEKLRTHDITVDDYFTLDVILQHAISPDDKQVAFTLARWQKETNDRKADLWVVDVESKKVNRLTFERGNDASPRWSPDSGTIYFVGR